jgi:flagellar basal-body rod modification protein FlgD
MQLGPVQPPGIPQAPAPSSNQAEADATSDAFGLNFESLLRIILTQLTYQDPLKPIENFEFVSQLAQFSQIQQAQVANERLSLLAEAQAVSQATALLGKIVDVPAGNVVISGQVTAVSLSGTQPTVTIETDDEQVIANIPINSISQVREEGE